MAIKKLGSGQYRKMLGLGSVQALHKRINNNKSLLYGLIKKEMIGGRLVFTVDTEQLKNSLKKVA